jgi:FMN phosphatase YigB (HAD superfamily)
MCAERINDGGNVIPEAGDIRDKQPQAVFVDYFDTLVARTVHPEDVKRVVARKLSALLEGRASFRELYALRARIEREMCEANARAGFDLEFNFLSFCDRFVELVERRHPESTGLLADWLVDTELATECAVQRLQRDIIGLVTSLRENDIPVYVVSDFYLPRSVFVQMLDYHGILSLFRGVCISADDLITKRSGRRYAKLLKELGIPADRVVMIGDNPEVDVARAREHGIHAVLVDRGAQRSHYDKAARDSRSWQTLARKIRAEVISKAGAQSDEVFPELALTLYYFIDQLFHALQRRRTREVFFLAREGQLLRDLFEDYQSINGLVGEKRIRSHYLEVSRRATFLPSLRPLDEEDFETLFRQYRRISLREFLENLGMADVAGALAVALGVDPEQRETDFATSETLQALRREPLFRKQYEERRCAQFEALCAYLACFHEDRNEHTLTLVDVGWKGTIQDNLHNLLTRGGAARSGYDQVDGLYVGLVEEGAAGAGNHKAGLVFTLIGGRSRGFELFNENRSLFEVMLGADHGSIKEYQLAPNGQTTAVKGSFDAERDLFEKHIRPIQQRLRGRFRELCRHFLEHIYDQEDLQALVSRQHARMVLAPRESEIRWIRKVFHIENFGVFEVSRLAHSSSATGLMERLRFSGRLLLRRPSCDLGMWPWLTIKERGLPLMHVVYSTYRRRHFWFRRPRV